MVSMITTATLKKSNFSTSPYTGNVEGIYMHPGGYKMYLVGFGTIDAVHEFNLIKQWDISTAIWSKTLSVATKDTTPRGVTFKPDGTKMYIAGDQSQTVDEYNLNTPWDISTAVYLREIAVGATGAGVVILWCVTFKTDGTKMYLSVIKTGGGGMIYEYDLGTAWDVTTASYLQNFDSPEDNLFGHYINTDGTKMYIIGQTYDSIYEYNLVTPWNITTASLIHTVVAVKYDTTLTAIYFRSDGLKMYICGYINDLVWEFDLDEAWNINTMRLSNKNKGGLIFG